MAGCAYFRRARPAAADRPVTRGRSVRQFPEACPAGDGALQVVASVLDAIEEGPPCGRVKADGAAAWVLGIADSDGCADLGGFDALVLACAVAGLTPVHVSQFRFAAHVIVAPSL